jgi:hypothetical protein
MAQLKDSKVWGNIDITKKITAMDVEITGNLIIKGTTTTVDTTTTRIEDSVIELGGGAEGTTLSGDDGHDRGILLHYYDGSAKNAFIGYKAGQIILSANSTYTDNDVTPGATNTLKGNIVGGYFVGNGDYLTNLTGSEVTGTVALANYSTYAGVLTGNAQPNVTSLGTLANLTVGNATSNTFFGNGTITATGTISTTGNLAIGNTTSKDAIANIYGDLTVSGNIDGRFIGTIAAKGSDTQIQFNDAGNVNANARLSFTKSNGGLQVSGEVNGGTLYINNGADIVKTANVGNLYTTGWANIETGNIGNLTVQSKLKTLDEANVNSLKVMTNADVLGNITLHTGAGAGNISGVNDLSTITVSASGNIGTQANLVASQFANITWTANVGNLESLGKIYSVDEANVSKIISRGYANITNTANVGNLQSMGFVNAVGNIVGGNVVANTLADVGNLKIQAGGVITGDLIPATNYGGNIGNSTNAWKDLWLSGSTINLGSQSISSNTLGIAQSNTIFATDISASGNIVGNSIYAKLDLKGANVFANNLTTTNRVVLAGTDGKLVDNSGLSFASATLTVTGNVNASANLVGDKVFANNLTTTGRLVIAGSSGQLDDTSALLWTSGTTELTVTGNANVTNSFKAGSITATGLLSGGNINTAGNVVAANIYGNNLTSGGMVLAGADGHLLTSANITYTTDSIAVSNNITATGNIVTDNIIARQTGDITITGGTSDGNIILSPGGTLGTINASSKRITSVGTPSASTDAATKGYVDANSQGLDIKASVRLATTGNKALTGLTAVDSVTPIAGDRILVKSQTTASENGIYVAASGAWTRAEDAVQDKITGGSFTFVEEGTTWHDTGWVVSTDNPITVGTTSITWVQFSSAGTTTVNVALSLTGTEINVKYDTNTLAVSGTNELKVSDSAKFVTPNIGAATGTSLNLSAGTITAGNVSVGTDGNVTLSGTNSQVSGANLVSATNIAGTIITASQTGITTVGTLTSLTVTADITANGNIHISTTPGAANGIFSDNYYYANGAAIDFQTAAGSAYEIQFHKNGSNDLDSSSDFKYYTANSTLTTPNANVTTTLTAGNIIDSSLTAGRVTFAGTSKELADDADFTFSTSTNELTVTNANVVTTLTAGNIIDSHLTSGQITFAGAGKELTGVTGLTWDTGASELSATNANIVTTLKAGNIVDDHLTSGQLVIAGAGKELSGVTGLTWDTGSTELTATNANVTTNLKAGNVTVASLTTSGSIPYTVAGKLTDVSTLYYETTSKQVYMPNANVTGTLYSAVITASGNISGGNIEAVSGGLISTTGNISGANLIGTIRTASQTSITTLGTLGNLTSTGIVDFTGASNVSLGSNANVKLTGGSIGSVLSTDGTGNLSWTTNDSSQIVNGTSNVSIPTTDGNINMVRGGTTVVQITGTGANVTGYIDATGNINGNNITASNSLIASGTVDSTSSITGTIKTTGGIAATGNIYTGHSVGFADNNGGTSSKAYIQFNSTSNSLDFIFN